MGRSGGEFLSVLKALQPSDLNMSLINRVLRPGARQGWVSADVLGDATVGVCVLPPDTVGGKPLVAGYGCQQTNGAGLTVESLSRLSKQIGVSGCDWTVPLHRKGYSIVVVEEPAVRADEMEQSVRWAVSSMLDYPVDDAYVAWMRIPTEKQLPNRQPHIYVIAARRELVENYRQLFKQAKINLAAIDIRETAHRNIASLLAKPGEGVALLSLSARGVQLTITFQGELYLDRHVDEVLVVDDVNDLAFVRALERVVLQVQRSLDFVGRTLPFVDISRVFLAPMPAGEVLRDRIAENLPVPVELVDLSQLFDLSRVPQLQDGRTAADCFVALGAGLRFMGDTA